MTLSDLAAVGSFVSGVAVLVSLVFLYFQLRQVNAQVAQTERNQRALMNQGAANRGIEANMWLMQSDNLDVFLKLGSQDHEFTERELLQFVLLLRILLGNAQDVYIQHAAGLVDQITFDHTFSTMRRHLTSPVFRAIWKSARASYAPEWAEYVDKLIKETPLSQPSDSVARFRANLAEVMR